MPKTLVLSLATVAVGFSLTVLAQTEKPPAEVQAAMKSNAATNMGLAAHIKAKDYDAVAVDAVTLKGNFATIEGFFTMKKVTPAIDIAIAAGKAATDLGAAARARDDAAIETARAAVAPNCGGCHKQFRQQMPDKTFEIRVPMP